MRLLISWSTNNCPFTWADGILRKKGKTTTVILHGIWSRWGPVIKSRSGYLDFCFKNFKGGKTKEGIQKDFKYWMSQLNGNIIFLKGNHDNRNSLNTKLTYGIIKIGKEDIFLCHNPEEYNKNYKINLVGHVHEKWKIKIIEKNILVNVGVDQWDFKPIKWKEINELIESKKTNETKK